MGPDRHLHCPTAAYPDDFAGSGLVYALPMDHPLAKEQRSLTRLLPLGLVLGLHGVGLWLLMQHTATREQIQAVLAPVMVSLIAPPAAAAPEPKPLPKPVPHRPVQRIAAKPIAPVDDVPAVEPRQPSAEHVAAAIQASAAAEAPAAIAAPSFNAAYLNNPPPRYPPLSRRAGDQGTVLLRVHVDEEGRAEKVELKTSSGASRLDAAAIEAVKQWRFVPARQGSVAVAAWVQVPITFKLEG